MKRTPKVKRLKLFREDGTKCRLRRCVGCFEMKEKSSLLRAVRLNNVICFDPEHKANGRGAYICKDKNCLEKAKKGRRLENSLKATTDENLYNVLELAISEE